MPLSKLKYPILGLLIAVSFIIWSAVFEQIPDGILEVTFFDIGQGDSIFIECSGLRHRV